MSAEGLPVSAAERRRLERRLVYALSRFGKGVERVAVRLSDETNALGSLDRRCRMRAWLRNRKSVAVETLDGRASFDRAAERLVVRVEWALVNGRAEMPSLLRPLVVPPSVRRALTGSKRRNQDRGTAAGRRRLRL